MVLPVESLEEQTTRGRKALATMGRRGGQKAAERWEDPDSDYARDLREKLAAANEPRHMFGELLETRFKAAILASRTEVGKDPSTAELAAESGVSVSRIQQVRKAVALPPAF